MKFLCRIVSFAFCLSQAAFAAPVPFTLLHTNDLHSHFRADKSVLNLGGVARLKTAIDQNRKAALHSLLVDGGDWSEGNIYYTLGAGVESIRMLDHLGYDVAVVGNHDWLNGPDNLLNTLETAGAKTAFVSANLQSDDYKRAGEFKNKIPPYVIREIGGVKIAFIGLSTFEQIYDQYMKPVIIENPAKMLQPLAARLKNEVDAVIVISHNNTEKNIGYLRNAPSVDLIIGAHDHAKLIKPVVVSGGKRKNSAWIVEAGSWGMYLGKVQMLITPMRERALDEAAVQLVDYKLEQIDSKLAEDGETLKKVQHLESLISSQKGPIFDDHLGDSQIDLLGGGHGIETVMGNFVTDAYRNLTHADAALDQMGMIYGEMYRGEIHSADAFNADPGVYHLKTGKSWTLHMLPISGARFRFLLNAMFASQALADLASIATSGMKIIYDPIFDEGRPWILAPFRVLQDPPDALAYITIQGKPIDPEKTYHLAVGGGIIEAFKFMNNHIPGAVPLDKMKDLGVEDWRVVADYLHAKTPITLKTVNIEGRFQSRNSDLAVYSNEISWLPLERSGERTHAIVSVRVRNLGSEASREGSNIQLFTNENGTNLAVDEKFTPLSSAKMIPIQNPNDSEIFDFDVWVPGDRGTYGITARITDNPDEINHVNDEATQYFRH